MYGWRLYVRYLCCAAFGASITLYWTGPHVDWVNSAIGTVIVVALWVFTVGSDKVNGWQTPHTWLRDHTLCRWGHHCAPHKRIQKFDGGKLPQLCCYCRLIVAWGTRPERKRNR
jgi:hypothetical protein